MQSLRHCEHSLYRAQSLFCNFRAHVYFRFPAAQCLIHFLSVLSFMKSHSLHWHSESSAGAAINFFEGHFFRISNRMPLSVTTMYSGASSFSAKSRRAQCSHFVGNQSAAACGIRVDKYFGLRAFLLHLRYFLKRETVMHMAGVPKEHIAPGDTIDIFPKLWSGRK